VAAVSDLSLRTPVTDARILSERAWRFYGMAFRNSSRSNSGAIGEVRYVLGWVAEQVARVGWAVMVNGQQADLELVKQVANQDTTLQLATNLLVGGELHYAAFSRDELKQVQSAEGVLWPVRLAFEDAGPSLPRTEDAVWLPISTVYPNRVEVLDKAKLRVRGVWPHPANPAVPDPPLFGVLDVLEEIEQLQDLAWAQNNSRVAQLGFLEIAKEYSFIGPDNGSNFHTRIENAIAARMQNPRGSGATPVTLTAPSELVGKGIHHTKMEVDPDNLLEAKLRFAIQRLAYGFPVPPEILLGMTSTNRATAYQIEESTYKSHIQPIAKIVGRIYASALAKLVEGDDPVVTVDPDPTELLARQASVPDLQWAYINGLISGNVVLRAIGVDPEDEDNLATDNDMERLLLLRRTTRASAAEETPEDGSQQPSVAASAGLNVDLDDVTSRLAHLDELLLTQLETAAERDLKFVLQRLGAQCRTKLRQRGSEEHQGVPNAELPYALKMDGMRSLGIDPRATLAGNLLGLAEWWHRLALQNAHETRQALLTPLGITLAEPNGEFTRSADQLVHSLVDWAVERLEKGEPAEVPTATLRDVIATAGRA
jgi:hypothetical protein